jgi:GTP pyrophosphokinase
MVRFRNDQQVKRATRQFENLDAWCQHHQVLLENDADLAAALLPLQKIARSKPEIGSRTAQVLDLLVALGGDSDTLVSACLYRRLINNDESLQDLARDYSEQACRLAGELVDIDRLGAAYDPGSQHQSAEGLRRLLLALVQDVRVVLIAICDHLVHLRSLDDVDQETRVRDTRLVQAIHVPLANRLGIWQLKWELEDRVFRNLKPDIYRRIAKLLDERRVDRERYIKALVQDVEERLKAASIQAEVKGRPKHIYSIWRKMQRKSLAFHELFDVRALRILVDDVANCYAALGMVHSLWRPIPGEFDDYIANPKGNEYRSLHTAIYGPEGKTVEIQIRTHEMHEHAELGVAAHWRYKEGGQHDPSYQRKLNWMRQLLETSGEGADEALLDEFGGEGSDERVYALTPRGQVIDMRAGSTVLDFAYHIHTDVGHRCKGAKVNGRIVPLTHMLENGEQVEILTSKNPEPSRDWLIPRFGYLKSSRARAKVRQWYKHKDFERNLSEGKDVLDKELKRLAASSSDLDPIVKKFKQSSLDHLYVAVAAGEVTAAQVAAALEELRRPEDEDILPLAHDDRRKKASGDDLIIEGVGNLMTAMAKCCRPVPGDPIVGYITRGRGVSIHRQDCRNALRLITTDPARELEVEWGGQTQDIYKADLLVLAYPRKGLIRDIGNTLQSCKSDVLAINSQSNEREGVAEIRLTVKVGDFEHLSYILNRLSAIPNVFDANRVG